MTAIDDRFERLFDEMREQRHEMRAGFAEIRADLAEMRSDLSAVQRQMTLIVGGFAIGLLGLLGAAQA